MMEFLKSWVMNIVTLVIFIVLLEILIPSNRMRKYINLVTGFVLVIALINPFIGILAKGVDLKELQFANSNSIDRREIEKSSSALKEEQMKQIVEVYRKKIVGQLEDSAKDVEGAGTVTADVIINEDYESEKFGEIKRVYLYVGGKDMVEGIKPVSKIEKVEIGENAKKEEKTIDESEVDAAVREKLKDKVSRLLEVQKENIIISSKRN